MELDALGPICFTRISKNCRLNGGVVLPALIDFVTDTSDPDFDLVTRRLELSELPPVGQNRQLREQLVLLEEQAQTSAAFRDCREEVSRFDAHHVDQLCFAPPASLDEAFARLQLLASTVKTTLEIADDCTAALALVKKDHDIATRRLASAYHRVRAGSWFVSSRRAIAQLIRTAVLYRSLADEALEWSAKATEALLVAKKAEREERKLHQQLLAIDRTLAQYLPDTNQKLTTQLVRVRDANAAFPALLSLIGKSAKRQSEVLCSLAEAVTLDGLAVMLGTAFVDLQEIAQRIVAGPAAYSSPPFGGVRRQSESRVIFALPPVDEPFAALLGEAITQLRPQAVVVFGETMASGCRVLRIRFRNVHSLQEIFVGVLKHNTFEAHTRPDRDMLCLGGQQSLQNLGIVLNGKLELPNVLPDRFPPQR